MASVVSGLSGNKAVTSLVITFFSVFFSFIDLPGLMSAKVTCNACNKSVNCKKIEKLEYLLDKTKVDFDVGISESRTKKDKSPLNNLNLKGYSYESCPMEYSAGGILLYISNHLSYKHRNDLCI